MNNYEEVYEQIRRVKEVFFKLNITIKYNVDEENGVYTYVIDSPNIIDDNILDSALEIISLDNIDWFVDDINNLITDYSLELKELGYKDSDLYI